MGTEEDIEPEPALAAAVDPWATSNQPTVPHGPAPIYHQPAAPPLASLGEVPTGTAATEPAANQPAHTRIAPAEAAPTAWAPPQPHPNPGSPAKRGNGKLIALVAVLGVAVLAGAATVVMLRNREGSPTDPAAPPAAAAAQAPTDTMLVRVDGDNRSDVYLLTPGSTDRKPISTTGGDVLPEWSHDRTRLAVTRKAAEGTEIWVLDADGTNQSRVLGGVSGGRVAWSADDTKLAFIKAGQLHVITIGDSEPRALTTSKDAKDDPFWSPDGKEIAYWAQRNGRRDLYALTVAAPREPGRRITQGDAGPAVDPAWSPDGRTIAYTRLTGTGVSDIWLVGADGSNPRALTHDPAREMDPTWSPDGTWLALTRGPLEQPRVVAVKADGSQEQAITTGTAREGHPCWS